MDACLSFQDRTLGMQFDHRYDGGKSCARDKLQYERTVVHDEYHTSEDNVRRPWILSKGWMKWMRVLYKIVYGILRSVWLETGQKRVCFRLQRMKQKCIMEGEAFPSRCFCICHGNTVYLSKFRA